MDKHIYDEKSGLHYTLAEDGIYYPDFALPEEENMWIGKYVLLREKYLKEHRKSLYMTLHQSAKLNRHLLKVNEQALQQIDDIVSTMAKTNGTDEQLKVNNQMEWVSRMNNYKACAEEVVLKEIFYC